MAIFLIIVILMTVCLLAVFLLTRPKQAVVTPQVVAPVIVPTPVLVTPSPQFLTHMPVIYVVGQPEIAAPLADSSQVQEIWKVSLIEEQAYELAGQRYDVATFTRTDNFSSLRGYCLDPGLPTPQLGAEYVYSGGIMTPLQIPGADIPQRFQIIQ